MSQAHCFLQGQSEKISMIEKNSNYMDKNEQDLPISPTKKHNSTWRWMKMSNWEIILDLQQCPFD